jgi:hypothetical protein
VGTARGTPPAGGPVSAGDSSHYYGSAPAIRLEKRTNGRDADQPPGPYVAVGQAVAWTYEVGNTGNITLTEVSVVDDRGVTVSCPATTLAPGATMICTASGTAAAGQYANRGTARGTPPTGGPVSAGDSSHYYGSAPAILLEKRTNGQDADSPPGPYVAVGGAVAWTYEVRNMGNVTLSGVSVVDDRGVAVSCPGTSLAPGATMTCTASGTAAAGQYANRGTARGTPPAGSVVSAGDSSHYYGSAPAILLEKRTNGQDADSPPGPYIRVGRPVVWTYEVKNVGNVALSGVSVVDDQGVAVSCPATALGPGATMICQASGEAAAGPYRNVGMARGTPPVGNPVTASDPSHFVGVGVRTLCLLPLVAR